MLAGASLAEEGVEGVVTAADGLVGGHLTVGLDAMLQAVQLPAGVADLDSGLADVDGDTLTLHTEKTHGSLSSGADTRGTATRLEQHVRQRQYIGLNARQRGHYLHVVRDNTACEAGAIHQHTGRGQYVSKHVPGVTVLLQR